MNTASSINRVNEGVGFAIEGDGLAIGGGSSDIVQGNGGGSGC